MLIWPSIRCISYGQVVSNFSIWFLQVTATILNCLVAVHTCMIDPRSLLLRLRLRQIYLTKQIQIPNQVYRSFINIEITISTWYIMNYRHVGSMYEKGNPSVTRMIKVLFIIKRDISFLVMTLWRQWDEFIFDTLSDSLFMASQLVIFFNFELINKDVNGLYISIAPTRKWAHWII